MGYLQSGVTERWESLGVKNTFLHVKDDVPAEARLSRTKSAPAFAKSSETESDGKTLSQCQGRPEDAPCRDGSLPVFVHAAMATPVGGGQLPLMLEPPHPSSLCRHRTDDEMFFPGPPMHQPLPAEVDMHVANCPVIPDAMYDPWMFMYAACFVPIGLDSCEGHWKIHPQVQEPLSQPVAPVEPTNLLSLISGPPTTVPKGFFSPELPDGKLNTIISYLKFDDKTDLYYWKVDTNKLKKGNELSAVSPIIKVDCGDGKELSMRIVIHPYYQGNNLRKCEGKVRFELKCETDAGKVTFSLGACNGLGAEHQNNSWLPLRGPFSWDLKENAIWKPGNGQDAWDLDCIMQMPNLTSLAICLAIEKPACPTQYQ